MEAHAHQARQPEPEEVPELTPVTILPSRHEQAELDFVRAFATVMDSAFTIPGTNLKIGLDSILGLIPGIGDVGSSLISAYLFRTANRLGVPTVVQARMLLNILIDTLLGLVPFIGDFLDIVHKANAKNAALIVESVENRGTARRSSWLAVVGISLAFVAIVAGGFVGTIFLAKWVWNHVG